MTSSIQKRNIIITKLFIEAIAQYVKVNKLTNFSFDNLNAVMEKQGISMVLSQAFYMRIQIYESL